MRRLLILGLLWLTACPGKTPDDNPQPTGNNGRIQGKLTPFMGSASVGPAVPRNELLKGQGAEELARALARIRGQQQPKTRQSALEVSMPDIPIIPPPPGPPPLDRLPKTDRQALRDQTRGDFAAARLSRGEQPDRLGRVILRACNKCARNRHCCCN